MAKKVQIEQSWHRLLKKEFEKPYFSDLRSFLIKEYKAKTIYPQGSNIFNAFNSTPADKVKAVIIGQDPYHGEGQAHGLCFSVVDGVKSPPSLMNIFKEIEADVGLKAPKTGCLQSWANQGVLMLNSVLTVEAGKANSHRKIGWERFTAKAIEKISDFSSSIVFLLWGRSAQNKEELIRTDKHLVLKAAHPSPLSAYNGFFGCRHFSKTNDYLTQNNKTPIDWSVK